MAMKEWFRRLQPAQLYLVLMLSITFFLTELAVSHITHALTLLVDSYHMLCNIIALTGCIFTTKYCQQGNRSLNINEAHCNGSTQSVGEELCSNKKAIATKEEEKANGEKAAEKKQCMEQEHRLRNTFGWARIDVIVMLICFVFLASLCFSILVEALQILVHIDHHDEMHHPVPVLIVGVCGLILNLVCYIIIGGYTFHQGSFLHVTASGDVVLDGVVTHESIKLGQRRLSRTRLALDARTMSYSTRQGPREMLRDTVGCVWVIICALLVQYTDGSVPKYIDPITSMLSVLSLLWLTYPYLKESGLILLQTIPDTINIDSLKSELMKAFPGIVNVHDLHVWQLTANKVISTAHIIFQDPKVYARITNDVNNFFTLQGITQVTVQPEFSDCDPKSKLLAIENHSDSDSCLMQCRGADCTMKHCCAHHTEENRLHKRWTAVNNKKNEESKSGAVLTSIRIDQIGELRPATSHDNFESKNKLTVRNEMTLNLSKSVQNINNVCSLKSQYDSMTNITPSDLNHSKKSNFEPKSDTPLKAEPKLETESNKL